MAIITAITIFFTIKFVNPSPKIILPKISIKVLLVEYLQKEKDVTNLRFSIIVVY